MIFMREKAVFFISVLLAGACIIFSAHLKSRQSALEAGLTRHGFDRTFVVELVRDNSSSSGGTAAQYVATAPGISDGLLAVLSRKSASALNQLQDVDAALPVAKSSRQLNLPNGMSTQVTIYNVTPEFAAAFGLSQSSPLKEGMYVPSPQLRRHLKLGDEASGATLGVANSVVQGLPSAMRGMIDWSKAKVSVVVPSGTFGTLDNSSAFEHALFTTGAEPKVSIPGLFLFPKLAVFIKLRDDVDLEAGARRLEAFIDDASPADRHSRLQFTPLPRYFAQQLDAGYIDRWATRIQQGLVALAILLFLMLALMKHSQIRREVALRRAVGTPLAWAVWLSGRNIGLALAAGVALTCCAAMASTWLGLGHTIKSLLPAVAAVCSVAAAALVVLAMLCAAVGKIDLAHQLKRE